MTYCQRLIQHFENPHGQGAFVASDQSLYVRQSGDKGALDSFQFVIRCEAGVIKDVYFKALGCPYLIASLSYICEQLKGQPITQLGFIDELSLIKALEIPKHKWYLSAKIIDELLALKEQLCKKIQ